MIKVGDAIVAESDSKRNLLPVEPGWDSVTEQVKPFAAYITNQLRAGFQPAPQVEVSARKPGHGVRPVPYWGVVERVVYRALAAAATKGGPEVDRSTKAYVAFVTAPGRYARDRQPRAKNSLNLLFITDTPVKYVVKSDLTAFYQFVDHAVLAEELLLLGADFEVIEALMELLAEVQGRNYGLPQLLEPSDALSEIYADRIERDLLRSGLAVWRFNDDFRVACDTYADALAAIESLDAAARRVGLVLSESKTVTVGMSKYVFDAFDLSPSQTGLSVDLDDVEDMVGDYTDDFGEDDADGALSVIQRAQVRRADVPSDLADDDEDDDDGWIRLRNLRTEDVRLLRRAVNGMVVAGDPRALKDVVRLAIYVPSLTPNLMRYLVSVAVGATDDDTETAIADTVDRLVSDVALNAWQDLWLVDSIRIIGLLAVGESDDEVVQDRIAWVRNLRRDTTNAAVRAVATRALAAQGLLHITDVVGDADKASSALLHIYVAGGRELVAQITDPKEAVAVGAVVDAWAKSSVLHNYLLASE